MRMRFTKAEKAAFCQPGTAVEWRNGRHWHPGIVISGFVERPHGTFEHIAVQNTSRRGSAFHGDQIDSTPTNIRLPE